MSIKKWFKKLLSTYYNSSFVYKILMIYVGCGFIPMLLIVGIFYNATVNNLMNDAYENMDQAILNTSSSLTQTIQPYEFLVENLKNDKNLATLLNINYTHQSYSDLAYYTDTTLMKFMTMYPELERIRFYCSNSTLPKEEYFFYRTRDLDPAISVKLDESQEKTIIATNREDVNKIVMVSKMHYFTSNAKRNYVELVISKSVLQNHLISDRTDRAFLLMDSSGKLITNAILSREYEKIQDFLPDWKGMEEDEFYTLQGSNQRDYLCKRQNLGNDIHLLVLFDKDHMLYNARILPMRMLGIFFLIFIILVTFAFLQGHYLNRSLNKILKGIEEIGKGNFQERIQYSGEDEMGLIAQEINLMSDQIDYLIRENYEKQLTIKSAELNLLQEQINPHFLYNALTVISSLSLREHGKATVQSIRYLADFYRISLNKGRQVITVREEVALLNDYMKIQMLRFSDLIEIDYDVEAEIEDYYTVKLVLQPLVENAIHHAREEEMFLSIHVRAYGAGDRICFDVEDNGTGMEARVLEELQGTLQRQTGGFGLKNVDKRIKLAYGQEYGITIFSTLGHGTRIHVEIPKVKQ